MQSRDIEYSPFTTLTVGIEGSVRLVGGSTANEGRVEVYHNGVWGTVCDDFWDIRDASVVCRQLNYSGASAAPTHSFFGPGSGPIHFDNMDCTGNETRLADCLHYDFHDCTHSEDAAVVCRTTPEQGEYTFLFQEFQLAIFHYASDVISVEHSDNFNQCNITDHIEILEQPATMVPNSTKS